MEDAKENQYICICDQIMRSVTSVSAKYFRRTGISTYVALIYFASIARVSLFEVFEHLHYLEKILK